MALRCGIVGLPNVGKSTLFNALTQAQMAAAANFPFCTIQPNIGIVPVPDSRLQAIADIVRPQAVLPTTTEFVDIAGLVAGASKGEGLGNQFLANIREVDAILHVVRCFQDNDIVHVAGKIDPLDDIDTIQTELMLADLDSLEKAILRLQKAFKGGQKEAGAALKVTEKIKAALSEGILPSTLSFDEEEQIAAKNLQLLSLKPVLFVANVDEKGLQNNPLFEKVASYAKAHHARVVAVCAQIEAELTGLGESDKEDFLKDLGLKEPGLNRVIRESYELLGLQTYFTAGVKEVRAWTIKKGDSAPKAAGVIHTDFEKGFIRAEVIAYEDFIHYQGEQGARDAGKWRLEGKDYIVKDGDIIHFRFNV